MRELPEPDVKDAIWSMTPLHYSPKLVLAIQKQAYEDGLRDAATDQQIIDAWRAWPKTAITSAQSAVTFYRSVLTASQEKK